ncbi:ATP-dependent DNA helicase RecG [Bryocella elongata]|uniref:ATP-dependent DNA helicase RecG n=1 Tax=Bryocella elongata TaxID=863522 RepID=UPI001F2B7362
MAGSLAERGVETVEDLLYHLPFRYEDRLHPRPLSSYQVGDMATVIGEVRGTVLLKTRSGQIFEMTVGVIPEMKESQIRDPRDGIGPEPAAEPAMDGLLKPPPVFETVKCLWFNAAYLKDKFHAGQRIALYGKLDGSRSGNALNAPMGSTRFKIVQPTFEILPVEGATGEDAEFTMLEMGRIVPVYHSLGGTTAWGAKLSSRWTRRVMWTVFRELAESSAGNGNIETLPAVLRERLAMPGRMESLEFLHFPPAGTELEALQSAITPAHRRLIFEEFFYLELGLELKRRRMREREGTSFVTDDKVRKALKQILPFKPTGAQKRVLGEIAGDMRSPRPMRRLLQGDVGSGKTIVALEAALIAIENGYQVAMMAPTELLATQHYLQAKKLLKEAVSPTTGKPYRVSLLTGSLDEREKREVRGRIFRGEADLSIGTHALVEEKVDFAKLGLVIVDEQHRFGVQQRFRLMKKPGAGEAPTEPDVLVMTATPIPRTLALTLYGDLDVSVLDELPPGRTPITTRRLPGERAGEVWEFVRKQVKQGRQAYIVYPIIEGERDDQAELDFAPEKEAEAVEERGASGKTGARKAAAAKKAASVKAAEGKATKVVKGKGSSKAAPKQPAMFLRAKLRAATEMFEELQQGALSGMKLGLLHGRMSADDKEVTMARFKRGELDVLVSTTVIEVGVDVPNATVMVIDHAERFGLAQLHQLRGRVGRGANKSYCVLMTGEKVSPEGEARLDAMVATENGFELAELDLKQRGPGEFFGTRQAGMPELRVADLVRDREMLELAKVEAARFTEGPDPAISKAEKDAVWARLKRQWQRKYGLVEA